MTQCKFPVNNVATLTGIVTAWILKAHTKKGETGLKHFWKFLLKVFEELMKHSCNFKFKFNLRKAKMFEIPSNQGKRMADWGPLNLEQISSIMLLFLTCQNRSKPQKITTFYPDIQSFRRYLIVKIFKFPETLRTISRSANTVNSALRRNKVQDWSRKL